MTTILTDKRLAHIGRRSEHAPDDGMMFRRRLIRSDEAWLGPSRSARPWACRASAHYQRVSGERSDRAVGDERLPAEIGCVHKANYACLRLAAGL